MPSTGPHHAIRRRRAVSPLVLAVLAATALLGAFTAAAAPALAAKTGAEKLRVVATLTDLASIARFVGGERVEVVCLSKGYEDPHHVIATPTLMVEANRADLFIEMGLDLEIWSESVLDGARNPRIRAGTPGHVFAAEGIPTLDRPAVLTRAQGDIHPFGNPHVNLSPLNGKILAANIAAGMKRVDPAGAAEYDANLKAFQSRIDSAFFGDELVKLVKPDQLERLVRAGKLFEYLDSKEFGGSKLATRLGGWLAKMRPVRGAKLVAHHKNWVYFERDFGVEVVGYIEPKPGLTPTPGHVSELKELIRKAGVKLIIHAPYYPGSYAADIAAETGIREITAPTLVGGVPGADDYFRLFDVLTDRFVAGLQG